MLRFFFVFVQTISLWLVLSDFDLSTDSKEVFVLTRRKHSVDLINSLVLLAWKHQVSLEMVNVKV